MSEPKSVCHGHRRITREQPSEVTTETILDSLSGYDEPEFIKLMSRLVKDNMKLQKKLDETEMLFD